MSRTGVQAKPGHTTVPANVMTTTTTKNLKLFVLLVSGPNTYCPTAKQLQMH
jgi:hypothetical protein